MQKHTKEPKGSYRLKEYIGWFRSSYICSTGTAGKDEHDFGVIEYQKSLVSIRTAVFRDTMNV
jgi:hypothetical protein